MRSTIKRRLKRVNMTSEQARREALIFPVINRICDNFDYPLNIEYTVNASNWLKGSNDFLML